MGVRVGLAVTWLPLRVVHESRCPEIGPLCAQGPLGPLLHDQRLDALELRAFAQVGLTDNLAVELRVPLRVTVSDITYRNLDGSVFADAPHGSLHHRDETLVGLGDPWLLAQTSWRLGSVTVGGFAGLTFPLGRTEENPFEAGEAGEQHQHVQDGSGTFDPVLGVRAGWTLVEWLSLRGHVQTRIPLYENSKGYQAGISVEAGLGLDGTYDLFVGGVALDMIHQQPERWDGEIQSDGNLGSTSLLAGVSAGVALGTVNLLVSVKFPVYTHIVGGPEQGEISFPAIVGLSVDGLIAGAP
jgi:hypothetical protein